jgi:hypothetical protein
MNIKYYDELAHGHIVGSRIKQNLGRICSLVLYGDFR